MFYCSLNQIKNQFCSIADLLLAMVVLGPTVSFANAQAVASDFQCSVKKSSVSHWSKTTHAAVTMRDIVLQLCDVSEDLSKKEQVEECKQKLNHELRIETTPEYKIFMELLKEKNIDTSNFGKKSKDQLIEYMLSSKRVRGNRSESRDRSCDLTHPKLNMLSIADNFGLITEEALRIKLERIKNEAEGFLSVRTPRAVYELAYDVASKLIDDFDSNKNRYLYQIDLDGKPYYALSETAYQEAKNAIKQVRAIGIKTEISKLAYLDFHFWLSPGEWSSDESDFRVSLMETLSKIKGDPMFSLVIDFSKEEHPVLFVIKTNALGRIKLVKQVNAQNGLFIASINKAYHYRILKTKYSGQLSVQCYNRDVDLSVLPQL